MRMTIIEFIKSQVATWGQEYVDDLFESKYHPVYTSEGWRWLYVSDAEFAEVTERFKSHV